MRLLRTTVTQLKAKLNVVHMAAISVTRTLNFGHCLGPQNRDRLTRVERVCLPFQR